MTSIDIHCITSLTR